MLPDSSGSVIVYHNNVIFGHIVVLVPLNILYIPKIDAVTQQCDVTKWHRKTSDTALLIRPGWERLTPHLVQHQSYIVER